MALAHDQAGFDRLSARSLPPTPPHFDALETNFFLVAPRITASESRVPLGGFRGSGRKPRREVKRRSERSPAHLRATVERLDHAAAAATPRFRGRCSKSGRMARPTHEVTETTNHALMYGKNTRRLLAARKFEVQTITLLLLQEL